MPNVRVIPVLARYLVAIFVPMAMMGCASITGNKTQTLRVEAKAPNGNLIEGADCELVNEMGKFHVTTPGYVNVRRSSSDLKVNCVKEGYYAANARGISRANAGMYGNILIGGAAGATIDHTSGAGYTYPHWMQLVFGRHLSFDPNDDQDDQPSLGIEQVRYR